MTGSDPKQIARELLGEAHPALIGLSHWIHANPELGYQEVLASGWVQEWLTTAGFDVRTGVAGMPTALVGAYGPGPFHVAVCVEYDALPAVGHACGHNVIAAAGVGAALALAAVADQLGLRVTVLGTPAEETGGGKIGMIKAGELDGVHAAMMVHPWPQDEADPFILAIRSLNVTYTGTEAHAAGFPFLGVNAADALVVAQTAIALLRQQLRMTDRVHGIVTKGGDAPNIIPARTEATWMVRGTDVARLDEVTALVRRCFEAGALATGATLQIAEEICYADVRHDPDLSRLYRQNGEALGRVFHPAGMPLSTDMGNISYIVPTIHPMIGIEADGAVNHQAAFAAACATPSADKAILDGALAMAWTAIDAAQDPEVRERLMSFRAEPSDVELVSAAWLMPPLSADAATVPAVAAADVPADPGIPEAVIEDALDLGDQLSELIDGPMVGQVVVLGADEPAAEEPAEPTGDEATADEAIGSGTTADEPVEGAPDAGVEPAPDASFAADAWPAADIEAWRGGTVGEATTEAAEPLAQVEPAPAQAQSAAATADAWSDEVQPSVAAPVAELDPDAAWAADVRAIEEQLRAASAAAAAGPVAELPEEFEALDDADAGADVLDVGSAAHRAAFSAAATVATESSGEASSADVLDVWVTPEALGAWVDERPDARTTTGSGEPSEPSVPEVSLTDAWFVVDAPAAAASPGAGSPAASATVASPATGLGDRDAWERAFEEAAVSRGLDPGDTGIDAQAPNGGADRADATVGVAGDRQEASGHGAGDDADASLPPGWDPSAATDTVSRERIEAEGFSFMAPDLGVTDELPDPWGRNGNGSHASEDMRLR